LTQRKPDHLPRLAWRAPQRFRIISASWLRRYGFVSSITPSSSLPWWTMALSVIGVVASALALHEPLGPGQSAAVFTLAAVVLATR